MNLQTVIRVLEGVGSSQVIAVDEYGIISNVHLVLSSDEQKLLIFNPKFHPEEGDKVITQAEQLLVYLRSIDYLYGNIELCFMEDDGQDQYISIVVEEDQVVLLHGNI